MNENNLEGMPPPEAQISQHSHTKGNMCTYTYNLRTLRYF